MLGEALIQWKPAHHSFTVGLGCLDDTVRKPVQQQSGILYLSASMFLMEVAAGFGTITVTTCARDKVVAEQNSRCVVDDVPRNLVTFIVLGLYHSN